MADDRRVMANSYVAPIEGNTSEVGTTKYVIDTSIGKTLGGNANIDISNSQWSNLLWHRESITIPNASVSRPGLFDATELITNGTFESNSDGWINSTSCQTVERNTTNPLNGTGDLHVLINASNPSAAVSSAFAVTVGNTYYLSFSYRVAITHLKIKIGTTQEYGSANLAGTSDATVTNTSKSVYTLSFVPEVTDATTYLVLFGSANAEFYVDNISLKQRKIPATVVKFFYIKNLDSSNDVTVSIDGGTNYFIEVPAGGSTYLKGDGTYLSIDDICIKNSNTSSVNVEYIIAT